MNKHSTNKEQMQTASRVQPHWYTQRVLQRPPN